MGKFFVYQGRNRHNRLFAYYKGLWLLFAALAFSVVFVFVSPKLQDTRLLTWAKDVTGAVGYTLTRPYQWLGEGAQWVKLLFINQRRYQNLMKENQALKNLEREYEGLKLQYHALQETQQFSSGDIYTGKACDFFMAAGYGGGKYYWINKGKNDGFERHQTVVSQGILLGRLIDVANRHSRMMPLDNPLSYTPVLIGKKGLRGIAVGRSDKLLKLEHILNVREIKEGDTVITSGDGGVFPRGVYVGTIVMKNQDQPAVKWTPNLAFLRQVKVLDHQPIKDFNPQSRKDRL